MRSAVGLCRSWAIRIDLDDNYRATHQPAKLRQSRMNTSLRSSRDHQVGFGQIGLLSSTDLLLWISSTECMPPLLLDDLWLVDEENKDRGHDTEDTRTTAVKIKGLLLFVFMNLNCCWWFSLTPNIIIVNFSSCCKQMMIFCRVTRTSGLTLYAPFLICVEIDRSIPESFSVPLLCICRLVVVPRKINSFLLVNY